MATVAAATQTQTWCVFFWSGTANWYLTDRGGWTQDLKAAGRWGQEEALQIAADRGVTAGPA